MSLSIVSLDQLR